MSLVRIAWRNLRQRTLSSTLTSLSMALGVGLIVAVLVILNTLQGTFTRNVQGFDIIVGAKGSRIQLVLNTLYHISQPVENIPYAYYLEFTEGRFRRAVEAAIPVCLGDNYRGYRVVGTVPELFELELPDGSRYQFLQGRNFRRENFFEAVVGYVAARRTGLKVGDKFRPTHGIATEVEGHEHDPFTVVGVLAPTGTPNDRAIFINMEGFYLLEGHALDRKVRKLPPELFSPPVRKLVFGSTAEHDHQHEHAAGGNNAAEKKADAPEHEPDHKHPHDHDHAHEHHHEPLPLIEREVTAVMLRSRPIDSMGLYKAINKGMVAQAVHPSRELGQLFEGLLGDVQSLLLLLAGLVTVVAAVGIMVGIYNSMSERKRDIAILRALGASRRTVMTIVLLESVLLSLCGGLLGFVLGHGLVWAVSPVVLERAGVDLGLLSGTVYELYILPALVVLATVAGYVPAMTAYRTDVAQALIHNP